MTFTIFPAIDLRGGKVVRLAEGNPDRETVYGEDPCETAKRFKADGAEWLHIVNLDAAFEAPSTENLAVLDSILGLGIRVQFGGGLRNRESLENAFAAGVSRAVLGTAAAEQPDLVDWALDNYGPDQIAAGIDARDGWVRVRGWAEGAEVSAVELGQRLRDQGVTWSVFTDVSRDGLGRGVNVTAAADLATTTGLQVIASGGVAGKEDVNQVRAAGLAGIVIGRALYEGQIRLQELIDDHHHRLQGR
ncbi:MAG: 1-(5-phosphoribosyl)-5-[(5-phosphoribosylamino)methylideneamino]imidazole-4-carboxamide isomerase [Hyphomicrobiales bacterium]